MKKFKVRIKKQPMRMGGFPRYQEGAEVPGQNEFDYGMMTDSPEPVRGSLQGSVTLAPTDADYPLLSIPASKQPVAPNPANAPANNSIYDYLVSQGQSGSYASRKELAKQMGIKNYTGTAAQNIKMLEALKGAQSTPQDFSPTRYDYTKFPGAGYKDGWDEPAKPFWTPQNTIPSKPGVITKTPAGKVSTQPGKYSAMSDVTNALTGARNYEEYAKKNPYFFNFLGVNDKSNGFVKAIDAPFHAIEDQIAKAFYDGDPHAIGNLLAVAAMGRGAIRHTMPGKVPQTSPVGNLPGGGKGLPQGALRIPGATGNVPARVPRGFTMPNRGVGNFYGFEDGGEMMAYGGQIGYGLDLNTRRSYAEPMQGPADATSRTLGPVNLEDSTYEAERGEVLIGDPDRDGNSETLVFGGKRHSQGGTPANEPGFIYSDTKNLTMRGPIVEEFGKSAGKSYTPADIAKQYDLNKYKKVMDDPNADPLDRKTAEIMYQNYEKKLAKLAGVQESMKGFPQGLPAVTQKYYPEMEEMVAPMQYMSGGYKFQKGGTPSWLSPWTKSNTVAGRMSKTTPSLETTYNDADGNTLLQDYDYWKGVAGRDFKDLKDMQGFVFNNLITNNKEGVNSMLGKYGYPSANTLADGILGTRSAWAFKQRMNQNPVATTETPKSIVETAKQEPVKGATKEEQKKAADTGTAGDTTQPSTPGQGTKLPYNAFDVMNVMSALATPVKSYAPRMFLPDVQETQGVYDQADYNPLLAAANTRAQMNQTFGNAGAAMAANTYNPELMQGLVQETARVRGNNLQTANQIASQNAQTRNQNNILRAQLQQDNYDKWVKTQEETDIANKMKWRGDVMPALQNMQNNRTNMQRFNMMYPQYAITGPLWDQVAYQQNGYNLGQKAPSAGGNDMATWLATYPGMKALYDSGDAAKRADVEKEFIKYQNSLMANMARNPRNMYYNQNGYNPFLDEKDK